MKLQTGLSFENYFRCDFTRNSEKEMKKRLKLQKEEFELVFARSEALVNEMAAEKRILQERCDKLMRSFDETETKYKDQIKLLQQKHLDEIKRLRKAQMNSENIRKQQWVGSKTQEIKVSIYKNKSSFIESNANFFKS
jgi:hypothetical protein